jgi:hypothetical protein
MLDVIRLLGNGHGGRGRELVVAAELECVGIQATAARRSEGEATMDGAYERVCAHVDALEALVVASAHQAAGRCHALADGLATREEWRATDRSFAEARSASAVRLARRFEQFAAAAVR